MEAFTFWNRKKPYEEIDVLTRNPVGFEEMYRGKIVVDARGVKIPVASIRHLKNLKKISAREQDKLDIKVLEKLEKLGGG